jgi:hypothetical protein
MPITVSGTQITFNDATTQSTAAVNPIPSGTVMLFYQAAAPTGWTKITTQDNKALRVVSGTGGVAGGTTAFSSVFTNQTPTISGSFSIGATTLSTGQMPSHAHSISTAINIYEGGQVGGGFGGGSISISTNAEGGGGSHTHSISGSPTSSAITLNVQYIDIILCSYN